MKRRSLLRAAAGLPLAAQVQLPTAATAQTTAAPESAAPLTFETPDVAGTGVARFFTPVELENLRKLGTLLVPSTPDTPGATEAGAADFLDFLISQSGAERQGIYKRGLDQLERQSRAKASKSFAALSDSEAASVLEPLSRAWTAKTSDPLEVFLRTAKDDFWTATVNSREYSAVVSKRRRSASGTGLYWRAVE